MAAAETGASKAPLLFFKVGVLGSTPLDFGRQLADEFDAAFLSSDKIRKAIRQEHQRPVCGNEIPDRFAAEATLALKERRDVVGDIFFNKPNTRDTRAHTPLAIARETGALAVALVIRTPRQIVEARVRRWTAENSFNTPLAEWKAPPITISRKMAEHCEVPYQDERIDHIFGLDGEASSDDLVGQVEAQLYAHRLLDE